MMVIAEPSRCWTIRRVNAFALSASKLGAGSAMVASDADTTTPPRELVSSQSREHQGPSGMSERGASAARTVAQIEALGFTHVLLIPDSESRLLYHAVRSSALPLITPCREGESIA